MSEEAARVTTEEQGQEYTLTLGEVRAAYLRAHRTPPFVAEFTAAVRAEVEAERDERIVSTVEELDALPAESVVRDYRGHIYERFNEPPHDRPWRTPGWGDDFGSYELALPVRVLYVPASPAVEGADG